jgi:hypothetical protein
MRTDNLWKLQTHDRGYGIEYLSMQCTGLSEENRIFSPYTQYRTKTSDYLVKDKVKTGEYKVRAQDHLHSVQLSALVSSRAR